LITILKYKDMETISYNTNQPNNSYSNKDAFSAFKQTTDKNLNIHHGMSVKEISEVVSEKIISVVKAQFEITKAQFEIKEKK
jgi:hypothetical protein